MLDSRVLLVEQLAAYQFFHKMEIFESFFPFFGKVEPVKSSLEGVLRFLDGFDIVIREGLVPTDEYRRV